MLHQTANGIGTAMKPPDFASEHFRCQKCGQTGGWIETKNPDGTVMVSVLHGFHPEGPTIACNQCGEHLRGPSSDGASAAGSSTPEERGPRSSVSPAIMGHDSRAT